MTSNLLVNNTYMSIYTKDQTNIVQGIAIRSAAKSFELYNTDFEGTGTEQDQQNNIFYFIFTYCVHHK